MKANKSLLCINDDVVEFEEFRLFLMRERSGIYAQQKTQDKHINNREFWKSEICDNAPLKQLVKQAVHQLTIHKVEQQMMRQEDIIEDISFSGFLLELAAENRRRKQERENGKPIYGPMQYKAESYYDIIHDNRKERLKRIWAEKMAVKGQTKKKLSEALYLSRIEELVIRAKIDIQMDVLYEAAVLELIPE